MAGCVENQDIGNTSCSAQLTSAMNACNDILSGLDCSYCNVNYLACVQSCEAEFGEGGG